MPGEAKTFKQKDNPSLHHRADTNPRNDSPDKELFVESETLNEDSLFVHDTVGTDEYPFKCPLCSKSFKQEGTLIEHLRMHIYDFERPYSCSICRESFHQITDLSKHVEAHKTQFENMRYAKHFEKNLCDTDFSLSPCNSTEAMHLSATSTTTTAWNNVSVSDLHSSIDPIVINIKAEEEDFLNMY